MIIKFRCIYLITGLLILQACQQRAPTRPVDSNLLFDLSEVGDYQFNGKMSFSDGQEGGSGRVFWQSNEGLVTAQLKAPLGSKSWRIREQAYGAELNANGEVITAKSAQILISSQLGWQVPWQQLKAWVVGQPHQSNQGQIIWQPDGYVIYEDGWSIEYSRIKSVSNYSSQQLAHKMVARKNDYAIKLFVRQWAW